MHTLHKGLMLHSLYPSCFHLIVPTLFMQALAESMGFAYVASGPMVRSSYRAGEFYLTNMLRKGQRREVQQQEAAAAAAAAPSAAAVAAPQ
eukprot:scaffold273664_cov19-Tisochrysis_lutea.AAC.1